VTAVTRLADARPLSAAAKLGLALEVVSAYAVARWALGRRGLRGALDRLRRSDRPPLHARDDADEIAAGRRLGWVATRTLTALPADSRCLMSSLVLTRLLARRGIDSRLVIGVEPGERFGAHAWVEHGGTPLLSPGNGAFEQLVTL